MVADIHHLSTYKVETGGLGASRPLLKVIIVELKFSYYLAFIYFITYLFLKCFYLCVCMCFSVYRYKCLLATCVQVSLEAEHGAGSLEMDLQVVVSLPM